MKYIIRIVILIAVAYGCIYLWQQPKCWERFRIWVHQIAMTGNSPFAVTPKEKLERLRYELAFQEEVLAAAEAQVASIRANAPICPASGRQMTIIFKTDPRGDIRKEITRLKTEIRKLEGGPTPNIRRPRQGAAGIPKAGSE